MPSTLRSAVVLTLLLTAYLYAPTPAHANTARLAGQVIQAVEYQGLETLAEESVNHYLFGRQGPGRLDPAALDAAIEKLWERELIDDLEITAEEVPGGVRLIIRLVERPILVSVNYEGLERIQRGDILERADRERISVYENQPLNRGELRRLEAAIAEMYGEKGFRFADVSHRLEPAGPGQLRVIVSVDEGERVKIGEVDFDGNTVFGDWRLRQTLKDTKPTGLISSIRKKNIYNPASVEEDLGRLRELYRKAGYKDVIVASPELSVAEDGGSRQLEVMVPIEEGRRWKLGEVSFEGNEVFSEQLLARQAEPPRGGWLRSTVVDQLEESVSQLYSSVGYIFAQVEPEIREREGDVADVVVKITESDQYRVARVEFEGNSKTRDKVLRREMLVHEGTVMNMTAVQNSLLKIRQLEYFALDEEDPVQFDFDNDQRTVDLLVRGEEAERTELQFGGGWGEADGFFGQFALRTTNFLGRGETVGISIQQGSERSLYDLEYRIPWFLDRPQHLSFRIFDQRLDTDLLSVEQEQTYSGASVSYGRSFRRFQNFSLSYSYADIRDVQTVFPEEGDPIPFVQEFESASIQPLWSYNTLDSRFSPNKGTRLSASVELAGGFLGGETDFVRPRFSLVHFQPVSRRPFRSSFGVKLDVSTITPYDDGELFRSQRLFLGGDTSVRGFRRRGISVREEDGSILLDENGLSVGGTSSLRLSTEYHMAVGGPFRVVAFADAGGVFDDDQSFDWDLMSYTAGLELQVQVPLFPAPLRFIYATNLDPKPDDDDLFESFDFSLSASF